MTTIGLWTFAYSFIGWLFYLPLDSEKLGKSDLESSSRQKESEESESNGSIKQELEAIKVRIDEVITLVDAFVGTFDSDEFDELTSMIIAIKKDVRKLKLKARGDEKVQCEDCETKILGYSVKLNRLAEEPRMWLSFSNYFFPSSYQWLKIIII